MRLSLRLFFFVLMLAAVSACTKDTEEFTPTVIEPPLTPEQQVLDEQLRAVGSRALQITNQTYFSDTQGRSEAELLPFLPANHTLKRADLLE